MTPNGLILGFWKELGGFFEDLLERRRVVEHFFLGVEMGSHVSDEVRAKAEVYYLSTQHADSLKKVE